MPATEPRGPLLVAVAASLRDHPLHDGVAPEIEVVGNATVITDGDATPALADHTDFGESVASSGAVTRTFTITADK